MNFEEFENLARLYVVGALDEHEMDCFLEARREWAEERRRRSGSFGG